MSTYEFMDKLPYDTETPKETTPVVDLVLPQLPEEKSMNYTSFVATVLIFALSASPLIDHYFGKGREWYVTLSMKVTVFAILYFILERYFLF